MSTDALFQQVMVRLDRHEEKIDEMIKAMVQMVRTEERVVQLISADTEKTKWLRELTERLTKIEKENYVRTSVEKWLERGVWAAISVAITILVTKYLT